MADTKTVYGARVRDRTGDLHDGDWFRVRTYSNPAGEWSTRAWAEDALKRAISNNSDLSGHVFSYEVTKPLDWTDWLVGDVKNPAVVPSTYRVAYTDTIMRAAKAAREYGRAVYVSESFRTYAEQLYFWNRYLAGGPLAARPGTSDHERGLSLDIPNAREIPSLIGPMRRNGMKDNVPSEGWHVTNMARK